MRTALPLASLVACFIIASMSHLFAADSWPSWRGPFGDGTAEGDSYPTQWDATTSIVWKLDLPGPGSSTPAILNGTIFLTHERDDENHATCIDANGSEVWSVELGSYVKAKHKKASGCNSSPVTDGKHIYFYFKSGDLACLTRAGEVVWHHNLQELYGENTLWWDLGTSPVLTEDKVIVAVQQQGPSFVLALNKADGELAWKKDRTFDVPKEAEQSYTTPNVTIHQGQEQIIVLGADHITAHDSLDGRELWRVMELNPDDNDFYRSIASATLIGDVLVAPYGRGSTLTAVRLGGGGDVTDSHVLWQLETDSSDVPTPANLDGNVLVCTDKGKVRCIRVETGDEMWSISLPKSRDNFSASPIVAGGHIYLVREDGTTFVLDKQGTLIATNRLPMGMTVASPVFADGRLYLRGVRSLYCMGRAGPP